jgi:hypothetical protein
LIWRKAEGFGASVDNRGSDDARVAMIESTAAFVLLFAHSRERREGGDWRAIRVRPMTLCRFGGIQFVLCGMLAAAFVLAAEAFAQGGGVPGNPPEPRFRFAPDAVEPIIEYVEVQEMLAAPDPEPLLRVYGDGRVHVHLPVYMKRAGDYELRLLPAELNALIRSLAQDGIIDFDPVVVEQGRQQAIAQQRATAGTLSAISDATETVITVRLDEYQRSPAAAPVLKLNRRFAWKNLEQDARRFPQSQALQGAAAGQQRLRALLARPDLRRRP